MERGNLKNLLIETLASRPGLKAAMLRRALEEKGNEYSIQGVYKELKKLQEEGAVFKAKGRYGLRLPWVFDFLSVAERMEETYVERPKLSSILPDEDKKEIWHFSDLAKLNDFWGHVLLMLINQSEKKTLLGWNPHTWFHLLQTEQEEQYLQALKRAGSKLYLMVGGATFLDRWAERFWDKEVVDYSFAESPFHEERGTYLNVIDDYVLTVKLDSKLAATIDAFYAKTMSMEDLDVPAIIAVLRQKTDASLWLEKNPKKASQIKSKFKKHWGIEF